jgi:hypothetical protein
MNRILLTLFAAMAITVSATAQGTIRMVSTCQCNVPAAASAADPDELDSLVTQYATQGADTLMIATLRYERESGKLLSKQVAFTQTYLNRIGYSGERLPYFYQFRYDESGREVYFRDYLKGQYRINDFTAKGEVVKTFDLKSGKLLDQELRQPGTNSLTKL